MRLLIQELWNVYNVEGIYSDRAEIGHLPVESSNDCPVTAVQRQQQNRPLIDASIGIGMQSGSNNDCTRNRHHIPVKYYFSNTFSYLNLTFG